MPTLLFRIFWFIVMLFVVAVAYYFLPVFSASDVPDGFVGEWQRRTEALAISPDGTVQYRQSLGAAGCTSDEPNQCEFNGELEFKASDADTVATAVFREVWLSEAGSYRKLPVETVEGVFPNPGDVIHLELAQGSLSTLMPSGNAFVFCKKLTEAEQQSPAERQAAAEREAACFSWEKCIRGAKRHADGNPVNALPAVGRILSGYKPSIRPTAALSLA